VYQVLSSLTLIVTLVLGGGLWAPAVAAGIGLFWTVGFLWLRYPRFFQPFRSPPEAARVEWGREIWPVQWRVSVVWLSSFLTTAAFTPIALRLVDPAAAGRMGMTVSLSNVLIAAAASFVVPKGPSFGVFVAQRRFGEMNDIFNRANRSSLAVASLGAIGISVGVWLLRRTEPALGERLLSPWLAAVLVTGAVFASRTANLSVYMRAFRQEPFARLSLLSAALTLGAAWLLGRQVGLSGIVMAYLVGAVLQTMAATALFRRCRARAQGDALGAIPSEGTPQA
jgi:O-antigen/teichoic acid export membrane protein